MAHLSQQSICFRLLNFTSKVAKKIPFLLLIASIKNFSNIYAQWIFLPFFISFSFLCVFLVEQVCPSGQVLVAYMMLIRSFCCDLIWNADITANQGSRAGAAVLCATRIWHHWAQGALFGVFLWHDGLAFPAGQLLELIRLCLRA